MLKFLLYAHKKSAIYSKKQFWYTWLSALPTVILMVHTAIWGDGEILLWYFNYISSFNVILSVQCRWTSTVFSPVFFLSYHYIYLSWAAKWKLGTLPCWPCFLPSRHTAKCKPILKVDLSLCACMEELAEQRNIYYAEVLMFLDSLYQTDFLV